MTNGLQKQPSFREMKDRTIVLAAGVPKRVTITGSYVHIVKASSALFMKFGGSSYEVERFQGMGQATRAGIIELRSVAAQTVVLAMGDGLISDNRTEGLQVEGTFEQSVMNALAAPGDNAIAAVTEELISASRATKRVTVVKNPSSSGVTVRLGPTGLTVAKGLSLEPGEVMGLDGSQAVYAYNTHATNSVTLEILEQDSV